VIFVRYSGGGEREFTSDIYAMNAAGTGIRNLTKTD